MAMSSYTEERVFDKKNAIAEAAVRASRANTALMAVATLNEGIPIPPEMVVEQAEVLLDFLKRNS